VASIKDRLKAAKLAERTVMVCLNPARTAELEELIVRRAGVAIQNSGSLEAPGGAGLDKEIADLKAEMLEDSVEFRFRALPRLAFTALLREHKPRDDDEFDKAQGFNADTFFEAVIRACLVEPELDDGDWLMLLGDGTVKNPGVLSQAQFDKLADAAYSVNHRDVNVPFLQAALHRPQISGDVSKRQNGSASARNGSTGGNPARSHATSTTRKGG